MLNAVPAPELISSITKPSWNLPARILSHAEIIACPSFLSITPHLILATAAERLIITNAEMRCLWDFLPVTWYCWMARPVKAP